MTVAIRVLCLVAIGLCLWTSPAIAQWANKPVNAQTLSDCPFSGSLCSGWQNVYNTQAYASFGNAPVSPSSVFDTFLGVGSTTGNGQWIFPLSTPREVYVGTQWAQNSQFEGNGSSAANKMIFISAAGHNNFLNWKQYSGRNQPGVLTWSMQQTDGANNCHVSGYVSPGCTFGPDYGPGSGDLLPNGYNPSIAAGSGWHKIEIYQKSSTTLTSRDGIIRIWIDGQLSTNYSNLNLAPNGFTNVQLNHTWDGGAFYACPTRDCTRAWHHYWDHMIIATCSGCAVGGGGSPPPPPPLPPNKPTNLRVQ